MSVGDFFFFFFLQSRQERYLCSSHPYLHLFPWMHRAFPWLEVQAGLGWNSYFAKTPPWPLQADHLPWTATYKSPGVTGDCSREWGSLTGGERVKLWIVDPVKCSKSLIQKVPAASCRSHPGLPLGLPQWVLPICCPCRNSGVRAGPWVSPRLCVCMWRGGWWGREGGFGESRGSPGRWKHNFISFQVVGLFQLTYFPTYSSAERVCFRLCGFLSLIKYRMLYNLMLFWFGKQVRKRLLWWSGNKEIV